MRVGDVALLAFNGQVARQRTAPAVFNRIAQSIDGGRLADDTVVYGFAARFQNVHHFGGAVQRVALLVGRNQKGDAARVIRAGGHEAFAGGNEGGDAAFHVRRAASVEAAVALGRLERRRRPFVLRPAGYDVGMSGEAQQRCAAAAPRPNVFGLAEIQLFDGKADFLQAFGQQFLTALVVGGNGCAGDELFGQSQGGGFGRHVVLPLSLCFRPSEKCFSDGLCGFPAYWM